MNGRRKRRKINRKMRNDTMKKRWKRFFFSFFFFFFYLLYFFHSFGWHCVYWIFVIECYVMLCYVMCIQCSHTRSLVLFGHRIWQKFYYKNCGWVISQHQLAFSIDIDSNQWLILKQPNISVFLHLKLCTYSCG